MEYVESPGLARASPGDAGVRKDVEKHLAQMEGKYRGLLEAAPDAMVVVNTGGEIVLLNVQAEKQFGYRRDELLGQKVTNIIPVGFAERLIADDLRSSEDALAQQIGTGIELIALRKDGSEFPIEIMLSPLDSAEGTLVTAAIRNISVRKAADKVLAQMEGRYRGLLEAAPDAMVVVNTDGEIVLLNVQAEKQFGYRRDELLGQKVTNIIPVGFAERLIADDLRSSEDALAQQIGTGIELIALRKDGTEFPIELMLSPLDSAEGTLVTAAIRNISVRKAADKVLAQMEGRYRGLLEAAPDAMVVVNTEGEIVLLNVQAEKQFGYRRDELLGQKVTNIIPIGFAERLIADDLRSSEDALAQQIGTGIELVGKRKDGSEFPIEIMLSPLESSEGILVTAAVRDISVRKTAEMAMGQMEARYRGLLEAAPDAMVVVNTDGEIVLLNVQAEKQFGYRRDELLGQKVTNIIPVGFAERLVADDLRSTEDALAQQIGTGIELVARRKDKSEFPIEIMLSPLESAEGTLVTAAVRDISVRKAAEMEMGQMEERYRGLLEAAPDAMVVVNTEGAIVLLNVQAEKQFGYRRDELIGQKVTNIIPVGFAERLVADDLRSTEDALAQQIGTGIDLVARRKDQSEFPIEIMLSPLESTEGILVTAAIRDISVRKRMERLKSEFVSSVSHELRTPLTSISASLGLLVGKTAGKLPAPATHLIAIAHSNSQRLVRLVNDILDIEKLDAGKTVFNYERVDVRRPIELAIKANLGSAEAAGVRIICDIDAGAILEVRADAERLAQALTNLLSNAVKFSRRDAEVTVTVEGKSNEIRISVRDHGDGVPDEFKPRIFERFAQADGTDTRLRGGTGLGLSIVKQIVDRLGGKVGFGDAPGGGALFYVDMPCWVADGDVATETEAQLEALKQIHRESVRDEPDLPRQPPRTEPAVSKRA